MTSEKVTVLVRDYFSLEKINWCFICQ